MKPLTADRVARAIRRAHAAGHYQEACMLTVTASHVARYARTTLPRLRAYLVVEANCDAVGALLDDEQNVTVEWMPAHGGRYPAAVGLS